MKKRAVSLWYWVNDHRGLAIALVVVSIGAVFLISLLPPPRGQECGHITYPRGELLTTTPAASTEILSCFWHAYQHCQRATINLSAYGTDTGEEDTITVEQKIFGCDVYYDKNGSRGFVIFRCASMIQQGENLYLPQCDNHQPPVDIQPVTLSFRQSVLLPPMPTESCLSVFASLIFPISPLRYWAVNSP